MRLRVAFVLWLVAGTVVADVEGASRDAASISNAAGTQSLVEVQRTSGWYFHTRRVLDILEGMLWLWMFQSLHTFSNEMCLRGSESERSYRFVFSMQGTDINEAPWYTAPPQPPTTCNNDPGLLPEGKHCIDLIDTEAKCKDDTYTACAKDCQCKAPPPTAKDPTENILLLVRDPSIRGGTIEPREVTPAVGADEDADEDADEKKFANRAEVFKFEIAPMDESLMHRFRKELLQQEGVQGTIKCAGFTPSTCQGLLAYLSEVHRIVMALSPHSSEWWIGEHTQWHDLAQAAPDGKGLLPDVFDQSAVVSFRSSHPELFEGTYVLPSFLRPHQPACRMQATLFPLIAMVALGLRAVVWTSANT